MIKRYHIRTMICMVLSLLMAVDLTVFQPVPAVAKIDTKSALVGGAVGAAAGAGIVLAAPAIGSAIAGAGGIAGIGSAILGGVATVAGGVMGVVGGIAGAIGGVFSAIGGFIAGIFTSPLFIPALVVAGAAALGYFAYKKYKEKKAEEGEKGIIDDPVYVTPTDYEMSGVVPEGDDPVGSLESGEFITIESGDDTVVSVTDELPSNSAAAGIDEDTEVTVISEPTQQDLKVAHNEYIAAYQRYTNLVTNSGGADPSAIQSALNSYRDAYERYQTLRAIVGNNQ